MWINKQTKSTIRTHPVLDIWVLVFNFCPFSMIGWSRCAANQSKWFSIWTKLWCHRQGPGSHQRSLCFLESLPKEFQNKKVVQCFNYYDIFTHQGHIKKVVTVTECFWRKKWQWAYNIKPFLVVLFLLVGLVVLMSNEYGFQFLPNFDLPSKRQWTLNKFQWQQHHELNPCIALLLRPPWRGSNITTTVPSL